MIAGAQILIVEDVMPRLSQMDAQRFADFLHRVAARGMAICYLTSSYHHPLAQFDRIAVFRRGMIRFIFEKSAFTHETIVRLMMENGERESAGRKAAAGPGKDADNRLSLVNLRDREDAPAFRLTVSIAAGSACGLLEIEGDASGKIFDAISGAIPACGELRYQGKDLLALKPHRRNRLLGMISDGYTARTFFPDLSLEENMTIGIGREFCRGRIFLKRRMLAFVCVQAARSMGFSDIEARLRENDAREMKAEEQFKVALLRVLLSGAAMLVLQNPERCFNDDTLKEYYALADRLRAMGIGMLVLSKNADVIRNSCDRPFVMRNGEIQSLPADSRRASGGRADVRDGGETPPAAGI